MRLCTCVPANSTTSWVVKGTIAASFITCWPALAHSGAAAASLGADRACLIRLSVVGSL